MSKKQGIADERAKLLKCFATKHLLTSTEDLILERFTIYDAKDDAGREAEARRMVEIINSSATEEEIVERVKALD